MPDSADWQALENIRAVLNTRDRNDRENDAFHMANDALTRPTTQSRLTSALERIRARLNEGGDRNEQENDAFHMANDALAPREREIPLARRSRFDDYGYRGIERHRKVRLD